MSTPFPDPIIKPFSNTGDNAAPPLGPIATAANQETGFPLLESTPLSAGGIPVTREEFNGAFNFYTKQILALVSGARFTFDQDLSDEQNGYPIGAVLFCASDNSLQRSLVNDNTFNFVTTPNYINDGVNWSAVVIDDIFCENLVVNNGGVVSFNNPAGTHAITFQAPSTVVVDSYYQLPNTYPTTSGEVLTSDVSGAMRWAPVGAVISSFVSGVPLPLVGTRVNVTSISLPPGRWSISLQSSSICTVGGMVNSQNISIGVSATSATFTGAVGDTIAIGTSYSTSIGSELALSIVNYVPPVLATTTVFYFVANINDISGFNTSISGRITAIYLGSV